MTPIAQLNKLGSRVTLEERLLTYQKIRTWTHEPENDNRSARKAALKALWAYDQAQEKPFFMDAEHIRSYMNVGRIEKNFKTQLKILSRNNTILDAEQMNAKAIAALQCNNLEEAYILTENLYCYPAAYFLWNGTKYSAIKEYCDLVELIRSEELCLPWINMDEKRFTDYLKHAANDSKHIGRTETIAVMRCGNLRAALHEDIDGKIEVNIEGCEKGKTIPMKQLGGSVIWPKALTGLGKRLAWENLCQLLSKSIVSGSWEHYTTRDMLENALDEVYIW